MTPTPILRENKVVALVQAGTLYRAFHGSRGIQKYPFLGIAFDVEVLRQATKAGALRIKLFDRDSGATYETDLEKFRKVGKRNPTNSEQWIMILPEWKRRDPGEEDQEPPIEIQSLIAIDEQPEQPAEPDFVRARAAIVKATKGERRVQGTVQCPICLKTLSYSVASNGHIMARCSTENCVRWME